MLNYEQTKNIVKQLETAHSSQMYVPLYYQRASIIKPLKNQRLEYGHPIWGQVRIERKRTICDNSKQEPQGRNERNSNSNAKRQILPGPLQILQRAGVVPPHRLRDIWSGGCCAASLMRNAIAKQKITSDVTSDHRQTVSGAVAAVLRRSYALVLQN